MDKYRTIIKDGTRDYLFSDAKLFRQITKKLSDLFENAGFSEIITPTIEYSGVFTEPGSQVAQGTQIYKFTDENNRLLALRPDCTMPIARVAATKLNDVEPPYRLFYSQNIFSAYAGKNRPAETTQCGVEIIGTRDGDRLETDVEICELALKSMETFFGLNFNLEIGHGGLYKTLIKKYGLDDETAEQIRKLIERKNFAAIDTMNLPEPIKKLPALFGGGENEKDTEVLDAFAKMTDDDEVYNIVTYIKNLLSALRKKGYGKCLSFDMGLVGRLDYYTGIIFGGFVNGSGHSVLSGGRYDNLLSSYGRDLAATGFCVTAEDIFDVMKNNLVSESDTGSRPLKIALTKGRLEEKTIELFEKNGIDCAALHDKKRKLVFPLDGGKIEVMLVKASDVITYVEHGVCDLGVVGKDTITEYGETLYEIADLGFGKCRMTLAGPAKYKNDSAAFYSGYRKKVIATKFIKTARKYLESKNIDADLIKIEGSVELAPILELSDGIIDIVETGTTLIENGLEIIEEISPISARMVANTAAMKLRKNEIDALLSKLGLSGK